MPAPQGNRPHEIESLTALDATLASGRPLTGRGSRTWTSAYEQRLLARTDVEGLVVLGGRLSPALDAHLRAHHALIFPTDPHAPINPYRRRSTRRDELYTDLAALATRHPGRPGVRWSRDGAVRHDAFVTLLRAIHDDSMGDALDEFVRGRPVVGVMGGHALARGTSGYTAAAQLGHGLATAGLVVVTGGGPGAMEAANLGAFAQQRRPSTGP